MPSHYLRWADGDTEAQRGNWCAGPVLGVTEPGFQARYVLCGFPDAAPKTPEERWEPPQDVRNPALPEANEPATLCASLQASVAAEKLMDPIGHLCSEAPENSGFWSFADELEDFNRLSFK